MNEPLLSIEGRQGKIELDESKLVIDRRKVEGRFASLLNFSTTRKEIPISEITGVTVVESSSKFWSLIPDGYIHIHQQGYHSDINGKWGAVRDENTLTAPNIERFRRVKEEIELIQSEK